ncbi:MAG: PaREP1 family protein [Chloroflexi bacterium]|nr:PaREP1 family protein [Chloroflexota bacterium]
MTTAERYQSVSAQLFDQAHVELEAGDLIQASEKFWGATAQALKAVAEDRGWPHKSHAQLFAVLRNVVNETGDREITRLFTSANSLHVNFYEHYMEKDEMMTFVEDVRDLIQRLDNIQNSQ